MNLTSTENKIDWCKFGAVWEHVFIGLYGERLGLILNPAKQLMGEDGKYQPDLYLYTRSLPADLKHVDTPFYKAGTSYNMDPQTTVTFNRKDAERYYRHYPQIVLFFWVTFDASEQYGVTISESTGVWKIEFSNLMSKLKNAPEHSYQKRTDDDSGNAKSSFLLNLDDMEQVA